MARIPLPPGDDPETTRALALRPAFQAVIADVERVMARSSLDKRMHELVRMRVAKLNRCTVCLSWRNPTWCDDEALLAGVDQWDVTPGYTDAERVALEYAERFCADSAGITDDVLSRLTEHFDPGEIVELTLVVGKYLAMGRFMQVLGFDQDACSLHFDEKGVLKQG